MQALRSVLIADLDGTLASGSLPPSIHELLSKHVPLLTEAFLIAAYPFYIHRRPKSEAIALLDEHREGKGNIIVFSSTMDTRLTRRLVQSWLKRHGVLFDKVVLRPREQTQKAFKLGIIAEEGCDILLENEPAMVLAVSAFQYRQGKRQTSCQCKGDGFFVVRFSA